MRRLAILVLVALVVPGVAFGQAAKKAPANTESVVEQIVALEQAWADADLKHEAAWHERHLADSFVSTSMSGQMGTKATYIASVKGGGFKADSFKVSDMKVQDFGNVAVVTGLNEFVNASNTGKPLPPKARWTDVWVRKGGQWQCVASHGSEVK